MPRLRHAKIRVRVPHSRPSFGMVGIIVSLNQIEDNAKKDPLKLA
jgi:hypothetical protein